MAYDSPVSRDYFFRLLFNGQDVTNQIHFCNKGSSAATYLVGSRKKGVQAHLCPIESIIRFLHDDYFTIFNATNMKDACIIQE
jgi:hypothetical protein